MPRWLTLTDEALFVVASATFIRGSFGFFPGASVAEYIEGCELYEIGSVVYLALSVFALWEIFEDARLTGEAAAFADARRAAKAEAAERAAAGAFRDELLKQLDRRKRRRVVLLRDLRVERAQHLLTSLS